MVYHLYSDLHPAWLRIRCRVNRADPHIPTITGLWEGAMFHEREMYDMMGIVFDGNRDLRRIYMSPDYRSFPQRKDFLLPDDAADSSAAGVVPLERPETWDLSRFREQATSSSAPHPTTSRAERRQDERTVMTATEPRPASPTRSTSIGRRRHACRRAGHRRPGRRRTDASGRPGRPSTPASRWSASRIGRRRRSARRRCTRWARARCCSTWGRSTPPPTA